MIFGLNSWVHYKKPDINFKFQFVTDLMQLKNDAEFLLDLLDKKEMTIFGEKVLMGNVTVDDELLNQLKGVVEAGQTLEDIGCYIHVPFTELTDEDKAQIDLLCSIRGGKRHFNTGEKVFPYIWMFRGKSWPIIVDVTDGVKLYGYIFNNDIVFTIGSPDGGKIPKRMPDDANIVPNFTYMEPELLANLYWYDYEKMYEQIDRMVVNEVTADELNGLALQLITAYDLSGNEKLLEVADEVLRHLQEVFPDVVHYVVNSCQIEVRKTGALSEGNRLKLYEMEKMEFPDPREGQADIRRVFRYCVAVLIGEVGDADAIYETLTETDKKGINDWPIRRLHLMRYER